MGVAMSGEGATAEQCMEQVKILQKEVNEYKQITKNLQEQVKMLTGMVNSQQQLIQEKFNSSETLSLLVPPEETTQSFHEFLKCNQRAQQRILVKKQQEKLDLLRKVFNLMKSLNEIGEKNEHIFHCLNVYIEILQGLKPTQDSWTWSQWWFTTQKITLTDIKEAALLAQKGESDKQKQAALETILKVVDGILEEQRAYAETQSTWAVYLSTAEPDADQVKDKLNSMLDKSGFEICKQLENSIREFGDDTAQFIEDHCAALLGCDISEEQRERVKQFADAFALNDWVFVSDGKDEEEEEVDYITWTLRKVREACSIYGYNSSIDHVIDTAGEYKSTCSRVKTTIEWVYFGGRLAVDPTGAMLSLLW